MIPHADYKAKVHLKHYRCPSCGKTFRIGEKIERPNLATHDGKMGSQIPRNEA
jgi:hypothetical protein